MYFQVHIYICKVYQYCTCEINDNSHVNLLCDNHHLCKIQRRINSIIFPFELKNTQFHTVLLAKAFYDSIKHFLFHSRGDGRQGMKTKKRIKAMWEE